MAVTYWEFDRKNGLKGVEGTYEVLTNCPGGVRTVYHPDPVNPAVLDGETILYALRTSRAARFSFQAIFPTLLPEEQDRLTKLLEDNPRISRLVLDDQKAADREQHVDVTSIPVRTAGPRGGKGYGRPKRVA